MYNRCDVFSDVNLRGFKFHVLNSEQILIKILNLNLNFVDLFKF